MWLPHQLTCLSKAISKIEKSHRVTAPITERDVICAKQLHPLKRITNNFLTIQTPLQGFPQQRIWGMHLRPFPNSNINMSYVFWMWTLSTLTHYLCLLSVWSCLFFIGVCLLILYNVQCLLSSGCVNFICHVFWTY